MKRYILAAALALGLSGGSVADDVVKIGNVIELSGGGASIGVIWRDAVEMAFEEINAAGGILGRRVELTTYDSQTDPVTSRGLMQKAIDDGAFATLGTLYSGSTIVNMLVSQQNGVPQLTGSDAPSITNTGNPFIFRTSSSAEKSIPKIATYIDETVKAETVAVAWINSEYSKGGRDVFLAEAERLGMEVVVDVVGELNQADFAADVVKLKSANPDAIFVYMTEEETARLLIEIRKQGVDIPVFGDGNTISTKVIQLAGGAANGVSAHANLTPDAPIPLVTEFRDSFMAKYGYKPDFNGMKGYIGAYTIKHVIEKVGEFDRQKFADTLHGLTITAEEEPGVLMDVSWDENGEVSRESFLITVVDGKETILDILPAN